MDTFTTNGGQMSDMISTKQAAALLGVSPHTIILYVQRGHFPGAYKLDPTRRNSPIRIPLEAVQRFTELQRQPPAAPGEPAQPA